jgi:para-aminobenzoate synthetase component I
MFQGSFTKSSKVANGPSSSQELALRLTPTEVAQRLAGLPGMVWLDSASPDGTRLSLHTAAPERVLTGSIWHDWAEVEAVMQQHADDRPQDFPTGGLFGWVGYDGQFCFGLYPRLLIYEHDCQVWTDVGGMADCLAASPAVPTAAPHLPSLHFQPLMSQEAFMMAVERAQDYISAGDIYQVNLSYPWHAALAPDTDLLALYLRLRQLSPAPHAAYLSQQDVTVLSSSPECFLQMRGRSITTRPIKGTRPRFQHDAQRDESSMHELAHSPKERAELLMITDLERNDLGMVCEYGTVHVPELAAVERYAQVFHLVSTVQGRLRADVSHAAAFKQCFPGGSITGAPKKRAREIIAELECGPRGLYTGALGYFGFNGVSEFNIAIRTAVCQQNEMRFHVGAGIVADSIPKLEWEETLHKAAGLLSLGGG